MTTQKAEQPSDLNPEAFRALEKRLEKTEKKLAKAKERAQATMKEIWQLDLQLKEQEDRAARAEAQLLEQGEAEPADSEELDELRIALHEAEERALEAEGRLNELGSAAELFQQQLAAVQGKFREAEERAMDWEERFHRSEERVQEIQALSGSELETQNHHLQESLEKAQRESRDLAEQVAELHRRLEQSQERTPEPESAAELEELRQRWDQAQEQLEQLDEERGSAQRELEEAAREREHLMARLAETQSRLEELQGEEKTARAEDSELLEELEALRDRLHLTEEKGSLYQQKAEQAGLRLTSAEEEIKHLQGDRQELKHRLTRAESLLQEAEEKLRQRVQSVELESSGENGSSDLKRQLDEALQRSRDAELKANQLQVKLQKSIHTLKEYEQRANESDRETQRLAFQDTLTGLPNLNLIRQYLEFTVKQVQRYGRASALLTVDLDRFKLINDAMGFKAGDELLKMVAERLQSAIRESDALGRRGEDEFLILLSELFTGDDSVPPQQKTDMIRQNIAIVVNRISEALSRPFQIQGQKFFVRASIGVSICPNDASTAQEMLEHADSAMYQAKESGRGRCIFYNAELHRKQERRLAMDSQLRLAMEKNEFVLLYQPILEVKKGRGTVVGVEALLRWNHRVEGMLPPSAFLEAAEESGLIVALGQWVCRQTCWQLRQWLSQGFNLFASVNVSTRQMLQADLTETIVGSVEEFGLNTGLLFVEIAEGTNADEADLIERVTANLGRAGVRIAIDDFGIGYSSLSRLDLENVAFLKIDPSLVAGAQADKAKASICEAAVRLAQSLGLKPLAEGVETSAQARHMAKLGCEFLQGFYFQVPCTAEEMTTILAERRVWKF